jgi:phosphatidylglycerophosphatase C
MAGATAEDPALTTDRPLLPEPGQPIVAFDVDGTLTWTDTFSLFLRCGFTPGGLAWQMLKRTPDFLAYAAGQLDRGGLKERLIGMNFARWDEMEFDYYAQDFAKEYIPGVLRADARRALEAHVAQGDFVVLVSASLQEYIAPLAALLGAHAGIGTRLYRRNGQITGELMGKNCRGPEKKRRLELAYGHGLRLAAAYGDSDGDTEMLAMAERPGFRVFTDEPPNRLKALLQL